MSWAQSAWMTRLSVAFGAEGAKGFLQHRLRGQRAGLEADALEAKAGRRQPGRERLGLCWPRPCFTSLARARMLFSATADALCLRSAL